MHVQWCCQDNAHVEPVSGNETQVDPILKFQNSWRYPMENIWDWAKSLFKSFKIHVYYIGLHCHFVLIVCVTFTSAIPSCWCLTILDWSRSQNRCWTPLYTSPGRKQRSLQSTFICQSKKTVKCKWFEHSQHGDKMGLTDLTMYLKASWSTLLGACLSPWSNWRGGGVNLWCNDAFKHIFC